MSKNMGFQNVEMASLKKQVVDIDLMRPGNGTPWEDRGSGSAVGAYFQTVLKSLSSPGLLLDHMRRPETTSDARSFVIVSGAMWVIGVLVWNIYYYMRLPTPQWDIDEPFKYWLSTALQCGLAGGLVFAFFRFGPRMYFALGGRELKGATPSLIFNLFAYSMGPSLLAVVPIYGWALAGLWIFFDLVVGGRRRLFLKWPSAIINALLITICLVVVSVPLLFFVRWFWNNNLNMSGLMPNTPPAPPPAPKS